MDQQKYQVELIERARSGDRESLDELATIARERLRTYLYRMTQEDSLTQDIVQETLFEMCKALGKLKNNERFWPWLHGIATNKLKRFYRTERTQRNLAAASAKRKGELAPSKAAAAQISVTAAATKVGLLAEVAVLATTKTAVVSLATAGVLTAGTIVAPSILSRQDVDPSVTNPKAVSFALNSDATYYYPDGPDRGVFLRATAGPAGSGSHRQILQDGSANYDYSDNTLHINNHRMWAADLRVPTLPTDDPEMTEFLRKVMPQTRVVERVAGKGKGLLVVDGRSEAHENEQLQAIRHHNVTEEEYFQSDWPATTVTVDNRDEMHRRGWTYFRIRGQINGEKVFGSGRIPFVHLAGKEHSPWLKLKVGSLTIVDADGQAQVSEGSADRLGTYKSGSFFKGLGRPWMGLHTLDSVRRDAAEQRIWFKTEYLPDGKFAQVEMDCEGVKLVYKIDLETDVIDEIAFSTDKGETGSLMFSYLQSIEGIGREFARPSRLGRRTPLSSSPGLTWLAQLAEGTL